MSTYEFLTPEWVEAAKQIRHEHEGEVPPPAHPVRMNLNITDVPHADEAVLAYMDTSGGEMEMDLGQLDTPDLTVTLDFETAKAILVDGNPQAGMQAFMQGKIKVVGDMTKLMVMQQSAAGGDALAADIAAKIKDITA